MEIKFVPASSLETDVAFDGKEFVSLEKFLSAFGLCEDAKIAVKSYFKTLHINEIQKRNEVDLLKELSNKCLGRREALYSPIVTKDGWVYWVSGGQHRVLLEALAELYSNGVRSDPDFALRSGIAWEICSLRPNIIMHGREYVLTREDKNIFELFTVDVIDF